MNLSIDDLERRLADPTRRDLLGAPDLDRIHRLGTRRRRVRRAALALATATAVAALAGVGVGIDTLRSDDGNGRDLPPAGRSAEPTPTELSPLAKRVLREVPGAVKVSDWQVVIPGPGTPPRWEQEMTDARFVAGPVPVGGDTYTGVTAYGRGQFPGWLYDEVERIEREELGDAGGHPVGSTEMGILVESGEAQLACLSWSGGESHDGSACSPSLVSTVGGTTYLRWGMGTDDFLSPGADMEVFLSDDYSRGVHGTIAIAGLDGTDVASADFVNTAGEVVRGVVESGSLAEGDSLFFANVPGELARVIAYDAAGDVIEDHELGPCDNPVDCEVR